MKLNWKPNIWTIAIILIVAIAGIGMAKTAYFDNKADALNALDSSVSLTAGNCKILSIEETINSEEASGDIIVTFQQEFYRPNFDRRTGTVAVANTQQATIETAVESACENKWISIQAEPQFQSVDSVVVQYHKGTAKDILNRVYDTAKRQWKNIISEQF
ncbi:MAG: hypothetical protein KAU95_02020 [Candidatus Aenigmarchaeota archaeon]|nr:hypothetical protein [Candidatus Aenigmarchaeota archaeon]